MRGERMARQKPCQEPGLSAVDAPEQKPLIEHEQEAPQHEERRRDREEDDSAVVAVRQADAEDADEPAGDAGRLASVAREEREEAVDEQQRAGIETRDQDAEDRDGAEALLCRRFDECPGSANAAEDRV